MGDEAGHGAGAACANCAAPLAGPYCSRCGQSAHTHRSVFAIAHDIAHGVLHLEGRIWHTLPLLAFRPGALTRRYIAGERAKFVSPMALFLFSVFLMFAVTSSLTKNWTFGGDDGGDVRAAMADERAETIADIAKFQRRRAEEAAKATPDAGDLAKLDQRLAGLREDLARFDQVGRILGSVPPETPAKVEASGLGADAFKQGLKLWEENPKLLAYKIKTAAYKFSWALIPISVPFIWLLFAWRRDVGLYDHAIFATYSLAFMTLLTVALTLLWHAGATGGLLFLAFILIAPVHMYKQLKGTYVLGRFGAAWRTLALLMMVSVTSSLFLMLLLYLGATS